ncbi:MAG: insulinase family protein [Anaerolineae bacterium]|nr:insulinase family protein [Phycisphaerae bacterium]
MADRYFQKTYPNGLTFLAEQMPAMQSAAMSILLPAGAASDPADRSGAATVLCELTLRGAGDRDNRALTEYLDSLGLQRSSGVGIHHARFACAAVAPKVIEGMATYADIVRRPQLPEEGFIAARELALQGLEGIEDEPRQKLLIALREWHLPSPLGRNTMGRKADLEKLTIDFVREDHATRYQPKDAIISVAGNIDFAEVEREVAKHFGTWETKPLAAIKLMPPPGAYHYEHAKSEQTHIGIGYPSVLETDPDYYTVRMAIEILGGGMSGRLFTEVREKRGLCYSVGANYSSLKGIGAIFGYAGTSNERAQATLDCLIAEIHRLNAGVTQSELDRAKIGLKASTIMSGESTSGRAGAIAHDYFMRGRIRTLDEIKQAIDGVTLDQVNAYLKANKAGPFTIVIVGPKELTIPK